MESIKKLFNWLIAITPTWLRGLVIFLLALLVFLLSLSACGTTHAVVRTKDSGTATITITTNNPTSVDASPNVELILNPNQNGN